MITLIGDIIKLSQLDENQVPLEREQVDLLEIARETVQNLTPVAKQNGVTLVTNGVHGVVYGVRQVLSEMVYNLCENAIKYNQENGRVWVGVEQTDNAVLLSVRDTGIGIPSSQQGRVFERFYRVDKSHSKSVGGTGLGELHQGTEITLTFPKSRSVVE